MKHALNNPWIVGCLCLAALGLVLNNLVEPLSTGSVSSDIISEPEPSEAVTNSSPLTGASPGPEPQAEPEAEKVAWVNNPLRDPFRLQTSYRPTPVRKKPPELLEQFSTPAPLPFILKAVAVEDQRRIAVINRTVVAEGENIKGYRVVSIQENGVWLQGPGGRERLDFNETK